MLDCKRGTLAGFNNALRDVADIVTLRVQPVGCMALLQEAARINNEESCL